MVESRRAEKSGMCRHLGVLVMVDEGKMHGRIVDGVVTWSFGNKGSFPL